jgi:hypothetical protein
MECNEPLYISILDRNFNELAGKMIELTSGKTLQGGLVFKLRGVFRMGRPLSCRVFTGYFRANHTDFILIQGSLDDAIRFSELVSREKYYGISRL